MLFIGPLQLSVYGFWYLAYLAIPLIVAGFFLFYFYVIKHNVCYQQ